jgi:DNA-binding XRE family transcriptional regulator
LTVYRCNHCEGIDNLYSGTVFEAKHLRPAPVILLLRGVCQGKSTAQMAREIEVSRQTVLAIRRLIQEKGQQLQPQTPLSDLYTETDDMFQNAGEKKRTTSEPSGSTKVSGQQTKGTWYLRERPTAYQHHRGNVDYCSQFPSHLSRSSQKVSCGLYCDMRMYH